METQPKSPGRSGEPPRLLSKQQALAAALTSVSRSVIEVAPVLYAAGEGEGSGDEITSAQRDEMLVAINAGKFVAVDIDMLAYEQRAGVRNRNCLRFRDETILELGRSGKDRPFLRDHRQWDSDAVIGKVIQSKAKKIDEGHYEIRQRARLTDPKFVAKALRGEINAVSIGWEPLESTLCSVCDAPVQECYWDLGHYPGARVSEVKRNGKTYYEWDPKGALVVEWIYPKAALIETSCCPIGGVPLAGVDGVKAALAALGVAFPDDDANSNEAMRAVLANKSTEPKALPQPARMETKIVVLTEAQGAYLAKLSGADRDAFLAATDVERTTQVAAALAADAPIWTGKLSKVEVRKSDGPLALSLAQANEQAAEDRAAMKAQLEQTQARESKAALRGRAAVLFAGMHGSNEVHDAILGAVESISDVTLRAACEQSLAAWRNGGVAKLAPGVNPELGAPQPVDALSAWNAALSEYAEKNGIKDLGLAAEKFLGTAEGKAAKKTYDASRAYGKQAAQ